MKRLLLPLLAAFALVGCQSPREKDISECIEVLEISQGGHLTPNEMRFQCECATDRYKNQDGNTTRVQAFDSCYYEQGLKEKFEQRFEESFEKAK